ISQREEKELAPLLTEQETIQAIKDLYERRKSNEFADRMVKHFTNLLRPFIGALVDPDFDYDRLTVPVVQMADKKRLDHLIDQAINELRREKAFAVSRINTRALFEQSPFSKLFDIRAPYRIPNQYLGEHVMIAAGSGHGKTQLICHFLYEWFK